VFGQLIDSFSISRGKVRAPLILLKCQSGQFFKGESTLPTSQGPIFYVATNLSAYNCTVGGSLIGSKTCPFEGIDAAYNHLKNNPQIDPAELRLAQGTYNSQQTLTFKNMRININGGYDAAFTKQDLSSPSGLHAAIKIENSNGGIRNLITFNGGRTIPFIEIDNTGVDAKSIEVRNILANNVSYPSVIKLSTNQYTDQALIENVKVTNSRIDGGAVIDVPGNGDVLIRNNFISGTYAKSNAIIYAEDNVKIVNNLIVGTPGGNETGGIYTYSAIHIKEGMDGKIVNNTIADNAFSSAAVKQESTDDEYMTIMNNLILGNKYIFNVPDFSAAAAMRNYWDVYADGGTHPNYGINQTYNDRCDPKLKDVRDTSKPEDYKLSAGSDCIDQGLKSAFVLNLASPDYFGLERPLGDSVDPGFSEYSIGLVAIPLNFTTIAPFNFPVCGNGTVETTEECDDGNTTDGDGCSANCTVEPECGNGILEAGEECDDGNTTDGDGCSASCEDEQTPTTPECGNGTLESGEECDDGNTTDGDGCSASCEDEQAPTTPECGNGLLEAGEQCDDGNTTNNDGCDDQCEFEDPDEETDLCANLSGEQLTIPANYEKIGNNCYPIEEVACGEWIDVSKNDPEFDLWVWLCERDILKGHADGTLRPEDLLTRAELLALAFRASDYENEYELDEGASYCFVDVDDEWFAPYACTAEDLGFVEGYAGNIFGPARKVILAEGLKMFLGALDEPFTINIDPNKWYYDMLFDAEDDDFLPYTLTDPQVVGPIELTRRKAANMLYRILIYR
jgi:cysteine-rich repeat protein